MNTERDEYIQSLEKRIEKLENLLKHLCIHQCKEISLTDCSLGEIKLADNCNITLNDCTVGGVIPDVEDAERRVDDLEGRLEDIMADIDVAETRLESLETDTE